MRSKTNIPQYIVVYRFSTIAYDQQYNITSNHIQQHITQTQHHTIQHNDMQLDLSSIYTLQTMISYLVYNTDILFGL